MNKHVLSLLLVFSTPAFAMQRGGLVARVARRAVVALAPMPRSAVQASPHVRALKFATPVALFSSAALVNPSLEGETIQLPSKHILEERLAERGLELEETGIVDKLAGKKMHPFGVALLVNQALEDYEKDLVKRVVAKQGETLCALYGTDGKLLAPERSVREMVSKIIKRIKVVTVGALLQDSPDALEQLKELGVYSPSK